MEDPYSSARRRADSPASTNTRMTPNSSNNSSANLPTRTGRETPTFRASSAAAGNLLQERLALRKKERRGSFDARERDVQSSPVRGPERPRSSGKGVKSTEEQLQTLMKTNFDLKLELFHRRNKMVKMEEELAESQAQQQETMEVNDQLLEELKTRDLALDEAIAMISDLEEKVARLTQDRHDVAAFDQDYFSSQNDGITSSPPKRLPRMPSFLSDNSEGAENLRSLYAPYSFSGDLPKLSEEEQDSPRLSVLSESSFLSVYGKKEPELPYLSLDEPERVTSDVKKWVEERPEVTPARQRAKGGDRAYLSLNQYITSPLQRLEKMGNLTVSTQPHMKSFDRALPPTPDTISTNTLRSRRETGSTDTLNAKSTDIIDFTNFPNRSHISERPRSAGETITSRRDGHGWDTETDASLVSTIDVTYQHLRPREVGPIFSFASNDWGKDAMFKPEVPAHRRIRRSSLSEEPRSDDTIKNATKYDATYGTSPLDDTIQPELPNRRSSLYANMKRRTQSTDQSSNSNHSKSPSNVVGFSNSPSSTLATPGAGSTPTPKRNRLASLGIFKRVEQPQFGSSPSRPKPISRETYAHSRHSSRDESGASTPPPIRRNRTQPQAPGYRPSSAGGERPREKVRDIIEETREKRRERRGSFTVGGTMGVMVQEKEFTPEEVEEDGKKGVRKWLGFGGAGRR